MFKSTLVRAAACLFVLGGSAAATPLRNDSDYKIYVINNTGMSVTVKQAFTAGCTDFDSGNPVWPATIAARQSTFIHFWRASRCHGEQGQVGVQITPVSMTSAPVIISTDFSADGGMSVSKTATFSDDATFYYYQAYAQGDTSKLVIHVANSENLGLDSVLAGDCYTGGEKLAAVQALGLLSNIGSVTKEKLTTVSGTVATKLKVTGVMWGFRGLTISKERQWLLTQSELYSKAMDRAGRFDDPSHFWNLNGPELGGSFDPNTFGMRALATSSTDNPAAQTVSVALTYEVAKQFAGGGYVYAFQLRPNSEVFGHASCNLIEGEMQVQPMGGTPIWNIMRSNDGVSWERWDDVNRDWYQSTVVPKNDDLLPYPHMPT